MNFLSHWDEYLEINGLEGIENNSSTIFPFQLQSLITDEEINDLFGNIEGYNMNNQEVPNMEMDITNYKLPTKELYISGLNVPKYDFSEWSEPKYQCTECGGVIRKNLIMECASLPPQYIYKCDKCGHTDYLPQ